MSHVLCLLVGSLLAVAAAAQGDVADQIKELLSKRDDAEVALVDKIAGARTRAAADGLVRAFDQVGSLLMRRAILGALAELGTVAETEQSALTKLANIAANDELEELRSAAMAALGRSSGLGKQLLQKLVDAEIPDSVREAALRQHCKLADANDAVWYRTLWNPKQEQRKNSKGDIAAPELGTIRLLAFQGLAAGLSEAELVETLRREPDPKLRRLALDTMRAANMPKTAEMAAWVLSRVDFEGADRAEAARIVSDLDGAKAAPTFLELAKKRDVTPEDLRCELARLVAGFNDDATNKRTIRLLGKGKPHEKVFALLATEKLKDPKVVATVRKGLADDALEVRRAAGRVLASRGDRDSLPDLRAMLAKPKNEGDARLAIEVISAIEKGSSAWLGELVGLCSHADRDVRNAAVEQIGLAHQKKHLPVLLLALEHEDWSTRYAAVEALAAYRDAQVVPKLIERLAKDPGRLGRKIADLLWTLTAQPFDDDASRWRAWWEQNSATFTVVTEKELDKAAHEREQRRLRQRTRAVPKFFGIKVESRRVIFIIDVSGSMLEAMYGRTVDKRPAARIDIARQELVQAIDNLEEGTRFNVFAFSSGVERWQKEGIGTKADVDRAASLQWVERLGASGGTNLYDALKLAFDDKDVDTIFVMSDGQPTVGAVIDPYRIREDVAFWNEHRRIVINTIAIGGNFDVLEWLAQDSGGRHAQLR